MIHYLFFFCFFVLNLPHVKAQPDQLVFNYPYLLRHKATQLYVCPPTNTLNPPDGGLVNVAQLPSNKEVCAWYYSLSGSFVHHTSDAYMTYYNSSAGMRVLKVAYGAPTRFITPVIYGNDLYLNLINTASNAVLPNNGALPPSTTAGLNLNEGFNAGMVFEALPLEGATLLNITYGDAVDKQNYTSIIQKKISNQSNANLTDSIVIKATKEKQTSATLEFSALTRFLSSFSVTVGFNYGMASGHSTKTFEFEVTFGVKTVSTSVETITKGFEEQINLSVPPKTNVLMTASFERMSGTLPFTAYYRTNRGYDFKVSGKTYVDVFLSEEVKMTTF